MFVFVRTIRPVLRKTFGTLSLGYVSDLAAGHFVLQKVKLLVYIIEECFICDVIFNNTTI